MIKKCVLIICLCAIFAALWGCSNKEKTVALNCDSVDDYATNDMIALTDVLTKEYDLEELKTFFENSFLNEGNSINPSLTPLTFDEVNSKFPVEIIRSKGYSVYKVIQGGYFYVFWVKSFDPETELNFRSVYFSAYLPSSISVESFDVLIPGVSTAEDVSKIDSSFELSFLDHISVFSYSYIDDATIMQIEYTYGESIDGYDALIVIGKETVARNAVPSRYSVILSDDLP